VVAVVLAEGRTEFWRGEACLIGQLRQIFSPFREDQKNGVLTRRRIFRLFPDTIEICIQVASGHGGFQEFVFIPVSATKSTCFQTNRVQQRRFRERLQASLANDATRSIKDAKELAVKLRARLSSGWQYKYNVRAKLRILIKDLCKRYNHPPNQEAKASQEVLSQAELLSTDIVEGMA